MQALLLAAGRGTRLGPITSKVPKPLLPIANTPILHRLLHQLQAAGVTKTVVVAEYLHRSVKASLPAMDMEVQVVRQGEAKGTGHAVARGAGSIDEDCLVLMGDAVVGDEDVRRLAAMRGFVVGTHRVTDPSKYGVVEAMGDKVVGFEEKPAEPKSDLANTGMYRVPKEALGEAADLQPSPRGELEWTDVVKAHTTEGGVYRSQVETWFDVGTPWDYLAAHEAVVPQVMDAWHGGGDGVVESGVEVRGRLYVARDAVVKSGVYVEGDVFVGRGAVVGPNAYLRGPIAIGPGCKVGASTEIKSSILLPGAKAPHLNYVGDSVLGHDCNLGAGTKVANLKLSPKTIRVDWDGRVIDSGRRKFGAVVGDDAKTGINASLNPGTIVGARAVVGAGAAVSGWLPADGRHMS